MNNSLTSGQYRAERSLKRICLHEARRKGSHELLKTTYRDFRREFRSNTSDFVSPAHYTTRDKAVN